MANDLRLNLVLETLNRASAPLRQISNDSSRTARALRTNRDAMRGLQRQQDNISSFTRMRTATNASASALADARRTAERLQQQLNNTANPTARLRREFNQARTAAARLETAHSNNRRQLMSVRSALISAGISTGDLTGEQQRLANQITQANTGIQQQQQRLRQLAAQQQRNQRVSAAASNVGGAAGSLARQGAVAGAVGGYFIKTQLLDTAAQFEDLEAVLRVVEGSSEKAKIAMQWTSDFAAKTPYELAEVTDAYKQLRAYGLDPTTGLLQDLGDTSAAMNKPILQAVEAIADAITGENERLKEFGIRASKAGGQISYEYTDKAGKQQTATVDANNRKQIESTLRTIWNEKFSGAMDERSRTWTGMISNLSDQWARFTNMVMAAGLFDWMKTKLGGLLAKIDAMAANGALQKLATDWGTKFKEFAQGVWQVGSAIHSATTKIAGMVGGWENLAFILMGLKLAPLISSMVALGVAMGPISLIALGIAAAAFAIYKYWEPISGFFNGIWSEIKTAFDGGLTGISSLLINWSPVGLLYGAIRQALAALGVDLPAKFTEFGAQLVNGLIDGLKSKFTELKSTVTGLAGSASDWFKDKLGIRSPSRVFVEHGSNVMAGLEKGLGDNKKTLRPMQAVSDRLKRAGTGLAIGAVAMNAAAFDNRAPLQAGGNSAGGSSLSIGAINIHAAPGMDEQALARMVAAEIAKLQTRNAASQRSRLTDED